MIYLAMRIHGWRTESLVVGQQALDVLAMGAPVLIPRLAFNLLSGNLLFVSLRAMMKDFTLLTALAVWCFLGFLLSLMWLGEGRHEPVTISKWMIYIWFGLDGTGIQRSTEFHQILGPSLMVTFAFLGNTLFLTILVSMLSNTFAAIVTNATAEVQFRHAVFTLEGVKSDAIFAYQPPFNILALLILVPLKFIVSPRWFHKIHVFSVRALNLPLLLIIAFAERHRLWEQAGNLSTRSVQPRHKSRKQMWFWEKWRITAHSDIETVFEIPPPDSVLTEIAADNNMTEHLIRRQFTRQISMGHPAGSVSGRKTPDQAPRNLPTPGPQQEDGSSSTRPSMNRSASSVQHKAPSRRDSIAFPGLVQQISTMLGEQSENNEVTSRLETLEESTERIERLLMRLLGEGDGSVTEAVEEEAEEADEEGLGRTGSIHDLDESVHE